jgi:hypothetical protein
MSARNTNSDQGFNMQARGCCPPHRAEFFTLLFTTDERSYATVTLRLSDVKKSVAKHR